MFILSEQQISELQNRCNTIKGDSDPLIYIEIESIVHVAAYTKKLQDKDINRLYELLNCAAIKSYTTDNAKEKINKDWDDLPKIENDELCIKREIDKINHVFFSHKATMLSIEHFRQCIASIEHPTQKKAYCQNYF